MKRPQLPSVVLSFFSCLFFVTSSAFAQDPPMEWGVIPMSDLQMKSYPPDTNASAVILCDYGNSYFNDDLELVFERQARIKILTANGFDWADQGIVIIDGKTKEHIKGIEGATYSLTESGEVVKKELRSKDIFEEQVDDTHLRYRFSLPGVTAGCVIEFKYTISTDNWFLIRDWDFQYDEPVIWSEYRFLLPSAIAYGGVTIGYERFRINESHEVLHHYGGRAESLYGDGFNKCHQLRYVARDLPAIRNEPYITTLEDYRQRLNLQLAAYVVPTGGIEKVFDTWEKVLEELADHKHFGDEIDDTRHVRRQTEEIIAGIIDPKEKMQKIYDWVSSSIVWSRQQRLFAEKDVDDVLEAKKGNNAEITFLLLSMLKSAGINGDPVILSTRANGKLQDLYPILSQFNYVLARVVLDSVEYYLDATDPSRPMDLLPTSVLNVRGLIVKEGEPTWITLSSPKHSVVTSLAAYTIHEDGSINGMFEDMFRDYGSLVARRSFNEKKDIDVAKDEFDSGLLGITIDSVAVRDKDSIAKPLDLKAWISSSTYAQNNGDLIYINPHIINRITDNPFKTKVRKFPVDYSYGRERTTVINITIPDSFEVKESLSNKAFTVGQHDADFTRLTQAEGNSIQIVIKFMINNSLIKPEKYEQLQNFYNHIIAAEAEQIVLERIKKPEPMPVPAIKQTAVQEPGPAVKRKSATSKRKGKK